MAITALYSASSGLRALSTQIDLEQRSLEPTNRPLDADIQGNGIFAVKLIDSIGEGNGLRY